MADNWTKLGDVVASLVALHNAAENDARALSAEAHRLMDEGSRKSFMLAKLNETERTLRADLAAQRRETARLQQSLAAAQRELAQLKGAS